MATEEQMTAKMKATMTGMRFMSAFSNEHAQIGAALIATSMNGTDQAFALFRLTQLRQFEGHWREARRLRTRACQMFKRETDRARIGLEEARLAVMEAGDVTQSRRMIHQALEA